MVILHSFFTIANVFLQKKEFFSGKSVFRKFCRQISLILQENIPYFSPLQNVAILAQASRITASEQA